MEDDRVVRSAPSNVFMSSDVVAQFGKNPFLFGEDFGLASPRPEDATKDQRLVADRVAAPESGDKLMDGSGGHGLGADYNTIFQCLDSVPFP